MPTARHSLAASVVNDRIYTFGGGEPGAPLGTVEVYDPATDAWTVKADMPRHGLAFDSRALAGSIYGVGVGDAITVSASDWE